MSSDRQMGGDQVPTGTVRAAVVVALVGLLLLLPAAAVYLSVGETVRGTSPGDSSGLGVAWAQENGTAKFVENGLAVGTTWSVNLSGKLNASNGTTILFSVKLGTHAFTVTPVPGYTAVPSAGNVTLKQCSRHVTVDISFTPVSVPPAYSVSFNETGLTANATWWVDFDGTNTSSAASSIVFPAKNGTYVFTDAAVVSGGPGIQFLTNVHNGTIIVNGTNLTVVIPYSTEYYLTTVAYPATEGTVAPSSGWYAAGSSVNLSAVPAEGYSFIGWNGSGNGNYSGTNATPTISMNSPIAENGTFGAGYAVDFEEYGLPDGTVWAVTFNGVNESAHQVFLNFSAVNGTYNYTVTAISGYHTHPYQGNVTVAGSNVTVEINWTQVMYNVTFDETGLPSGTSWSVTLNGSPESSVTSRIGFIEPNGTLSYTVAPVSGYTANVTSGSVHIQGANLTVYILWTAVGPTSPKTYNVTFLETGLPTATSWSVTLNHSAKSSTTTSIVFTERNGTVGFTVAPVSGYTANVTSGSVDVKGANQTVYIRWTATTSAPETYSITFLETGLPTGTNWSVVLNGSSSVHRSSTSGSAVFTGLANGTYTYWVPDVGSYAPAHATETVSLSSANLTVEVSFTAPTSPAHTSTSASISVLDLIIIVLIIGIGAAVTWAIYRRT
jgi:hypothetical protein